MVTYWQPLKACLSIVVLVEMMGIRPVQPSKSISPTKLHWDRLADVKLVQLLKTCCPMEVMPVRSHMPVVLLLKVLRFLQPEKQFDGMVFIVSVGHVTAVMLVH